MVEFVEASVEDLVASTEFLHYIKPDLRDKLVIGIEKAQPLDQNVVFHLSKIGSKDEHEIFMLSAEYISEHPYFKN